MGNWFFPSRGYGETEGFSNPGLELFKGEPIRAMAREVCQNSLDAKLDNDKPLRVEFHRHFMDVASFPGMVEMRDILKKCREFWDGKGDPKASQFIKDATNTLSGDKFFVLQISDYNTTGLQGAFSSEELTPWKGLVQGNAFSIKSDDSAAGSYGIGKAAPFVVSKLQTVFYRTCDEEGNTAAQGVTHLVSYKDDKCNENEDPVRRSTGYFSTNSLNTPFRELELLEQLNLRNESGTDLFIPGFNFATSKANDWKDDIIIEILENFLYSIYSGKMEVIVDDKILNASTVEKHIQRLLPKTKKAASFYNVICDNDDVIQESKDFYSLGTLNLRLLYHPDAIRKVLVVRSSGMKISDIPNLPKGISFVGFLELKGQGLNSFFRKMENPQHNKWEPNRHSNPDLARKYKNEVEDWVRGVIGEKIKEIAGDEIDIDLSAYFMASDREEAQESDETIEKILDTIDTVKQVEISQDTSSDKRFKVKDIGGNLQNPPSGNRRAGVIDDEGESQGHRRRTGKRTGATPKGRKGYEDENGLDNVYDGMHEIYVTARIVKRSDGVNRLIFVAEENINQGELEIVTVGENGKPLQLRVKQVSGVNVSAELKNSHITVFNVEEGQKNKIDFEIIGNQNYAMGVRAYGN